MMTTTTEVLPGAPIIARAKRLVWVAVVAALVYSLVTTGTRSGCPSGVAFSGAEIANAPGLCWQLQLRPSPLVYIAIAAAVLWALSRVHRRATSVEEAARMMDRAVVLIVALVGVSFAVTTAWFWLLDFSAWDGRSYAVVFPFPFGSGEFSTYPASGMP